jgi:hypothetical protein
LDTANIEGFETSEYGRLTGATNPSLVSRKDALSRIFLKSQIVDGPISASCKHDAAEFCEAYELASIHKISW